MPSSLHKKALEFFKADQFEKAIKLFDQAIEENNTDPDLFHDRGVCYFHMKRKQEALADMNEALKLQPDYSYRYSSRAYMKGHLKDLEGAIEDYKKAIELDPDDAIAYNNLGLLEEQLGYQESAKKRFAKADALSELLKESGIDLESARTEEPRNIQKEIDEEKKQNQGNGAVIREMFSVFKSKENFREFLSFIKNGFSNKD